MSTFGEIATNIKKIDTNKILIEVLKEKSVQINILNLIKTRLHYKGIDSNGNTLKTDMSVGNNKYAFSTIYEKKRFLGKIARGLRYKNVTLFNDGDFYHSFKILILTHSFKIDADFIKRDGHIQKNFEDMYASPKKMEDLIMSLNENELNKIVDEYIEPEFFKILDESL